MPGAGPSASRGSELARRDRGYTVSLAEVGSALRVIVSRSAASPRDPVAPDSRPPQDDWASPRAAVANRGSCTTTRSPPTSGPPRPLSTASARQGGRSTSGPFRQRGQEANLRGHRTSQTALVCPSSEPAHAPGPGSSGWTTLPALDKH